jgi:alpha-glucosidase (family GH31 glycosyl hydrolase)
MLLSAGISGHSFGGADLPGFYGVPSEEVFV